MSNIEKIVKKLSRLNQVIEDKIVQEHSKNRSLTTSLKKQELVIDNLFSKNNQLNVRIKKSENELKNIKNQLENKNIAQEKKLIRYYKKLNKIIDDLQSDDSFNDYLKELDVFINKNPSIKENQENGLKLNTKFEWDSNISDQISKNQNEKNYFEINRQLEKILKSIGL